MKRKSKKGSRTVRIVYVLVVPTCFILMKKGAFMVCIHPSSNNYLILCILDDKVYCSACTCHSCAKILPKFTLGGVDEKSCFDCSSNAPHVSRR